jgi:hypothetical protein
VAAWFGLGLGRVDLSEKQGHISDIKPLDNHLDVWYDTLMQRELIIPRLVEVARQEILKDFRPDSCIASTHTVIRVLKHFGWVYEPVVVQAHIFSPAFVKVVAAGNLPPKDGNLHFWCEQQGAWSIGLGLGEGPEDRHKWPGHLVAVNPVSRVMIDASLNQCDRPQYDIHLPPVFSSLVTEDFLLGLGEVAYDINGCAVKYVRVKEPAPFKHSPDWRDHKRVKRAVKAIIKHIEES